MIRLSLRTLRVHAGRFASTVTAIALGVAFLVGVLLLTTGFQRSFEDMFASGAAQTDAVVRAGDGIDLGFGDSARGRLDKSMTDIVAAVPGVSSVAVERQGLAQIEASDGNLIGGGGPPQVGSQWIANANLNPWVLADGRAPTGPDEIVIDAAAAREGDLGVGNSTRVFTPEAVPVTIVGIATYGTADSVGPLTTALFSEAGAVAHLGFHPTEVDSILVKADAGLSERAIVERLQSSLPAGTEAITADASITELQQIGADFLSVIRPVLLAFVGLALAVGAFSIYNTFAIVVAQRVRDGALLRTLGASRRQLLASTLFEAVVVGLAGTFIGVTLGTGLAALAGTALSGWIGSGAVNVSLSPAIVIASLAVGVGVTAMAGLIPARQAASVSPMEALRSAATDRSRVIGPRLVIGTVLTGSGIALGIAAVATLGGRWAAVAGALLLLGSLVLAPTLAGPVVGGLGIPVTRIKGVTGSLARRNAIRNPSRTGNTAAALIVGVAVVALFAVIGASVKASLDTIIGQSIAGDVVVQGPAADAGIGIGDDLRNRIEGVDGLETSVGLGDLTAAVDGVQGFLNFADANELGTVLDLQLTSGDLVGMGEGDLALARSDATARSLSVGDTVKARFPGGGDANLTVRAIYEDSPLAGLMFVDTTTAEAYDESAAAGLLLLKAKPGVSPASLDSAVQAAVADWPGVSVQTRAEFAEAQGRSVDMMLTLVYGLLALSVVIALSGIANTLALSVLERRRELGLLRAVGQDRSQTRSMIRWEAVLVASVGTMVGLAVGVASAWMLISSASGDFAEMAVPTGTLITLVVIGALAGVLASARPARRAAKADVLAAIAAP